MQTRDFLRKDDMCVIRNGLNRISTSLLNVQENWYQNKSQAWYLYLKLTSIHLNWIMQQLKLVKRMDLERQYN